MTAIYKTTLTQASKQRKSIQLIWMKVCRLKYKRIKKRYKIRKI